MKARITAVVIAIAIFVLSLVGMLFVCGLGYFVWSDEEFGVARRVVITLFGVMPGGIVSLGFFLSSVRDLASLVAGTSKDEAEDHAEAEHAEK
ncbi:MAG: hypothetical protein AAGD07_21055 [Planctomycetota bacterium]